MGQGGPQGAGLAALQLEIRGGASQQHGTAEAVRNSPDSACIEGVAYRLPWWIECRL